MNAPTSNFTEPVFGKIPLASVIPSKNNPRKTFREEGLEELAASIKAQGLGQPILVRPLPTTEAQIDCVEIVAGERRYRAAKLAGLTDILAVVKEMSDEEAAKFRLIENVQREDVPEIEEAEGIEALMKDFKLTADQVAKELGMSKSTIYARLKLCELCQPARDIVLQYGLPASIALLLARIPVPSLQEHAAKEVSVGNGGEPMSYRRAAEHLRERYMLNLDRARFSIKDAKLVKEVGSCEDCPKRTGNQPMIYGDVNADVCTDPNCFASKSRAHDDKTLATAQKKGTPVYEGVEAQQFMKDTELVSAEEGVYNFERRVDTSYYSKPVGELLTPEQLPKPAAFVRIDGKVKAMYEPTAMQAALEKAGVCETAEQREAREREVAEKTDAETAVTPEKKAPAATQIDIRVLAAEQEYEARLEAYKRIRTNTDLASSPELLRPILKALIGLYETYSDYSLPDDALSDLYEFDTSSDEKIAAYIDQAPASTLLLLLMDTIMGRAIDVGTHDMMADGSIDEDDGNYQAFVALTDAAGIDLGQIRAELSPAAEEIDLGDRVRVNDDAKGPNGKKRKCCGKEGTVTVIDVTGPKPIYTVEFGSKKSDVFSDLARSELTKVEPAANVEASEEDSSEQAPENVQPKTAKSKAPKAKADKDKPVIDPAAAWPFPTGNRG